MKKERRVVLAYVTRCPFLLLKYYNPVCNNQGKCFSVTAQAAFDHLRTTFWDGSTNEYESLTKAGQWHWDLKMGYSF